MSAPFAPKASARLCGVNEVGDESGYGGGEQEEDGWDDNAGDDDQCFRQSYGFFGVRGTRGRFVSENETTRLRCAMCERGRDECPRGSAAMGGSPEGDHISDWGTQARQRVFAPLSSRG